jgi:hypothetical protein
MLYDQAQLVLALLEAGQASGDPLWGAVADDTLAYVARDLTHSDGGFYSAEDADSVPVEAAGTPGARASEGAFYLWSADEVQALLGGDAPIVVARFGIETGGNAPHDPQGEFVSRNILYVARPIEDVAARTGKSPGEVMAALERGRRTLFDARARRPRPALDDKVLAAWNGLMIAACGRAARVFAGGTAGESARSSERALAMAQRAARFVSRELWHPETRTLMRRYRAWTAGVPAFGEDYACLCWGLLELFQADGDPEWLEWAIALHERQNELFWDDEEGGWFSTTGEDPSILLRLKDDHDGAEPSATSVAVGNALTLAHLLREERYLVQTRRALAHATARIERGARAVPMLLCGLARWHALAGTASPASEGAVPWSASQVPFQVVIVGPPGAPATRALHAVVARRYLPHAIVIPVEPGPRQAKVAARLPWIGAMATTDDRPSAYVCRDLACLAPVTTAQELEAILGGHAP